MANDLTSYTTYQSLQGTQMSQVQEASRLPVTGKAGGGAGMDDQRRSSSPPPLSVLNHKWTSISHLSKAQGVGSKDCKNQRLASTGEKQGLLDTSGLLPS